MEAIEQTVEKDDKWVEALASFVSIGEPEKYEEYKKRIMERKKEFEPFFKGVKITGEIMFDFMERMREFVKKKLKEVS